MTKEKCTHKHTNERVYSSLCLVHCFLCLIIFQGMDGMRHTRASGRPRGNYPAANPIRRSAICTPRGICRHRLSPTSKTNTPHRAPLEEDAHNETCTRPPMIRLKHTAGGPLPSPFRCGLADPRPHLRRPDFLESQSPERRTAPFSKSPNTRSGPGRSASTEFAWCSEVLALLIHRGASVQDLSK